MKKIVLVRTLFISLLASVLTGCLFQQAVVKSQVDTRQSAATMVYVSNAESREIYIMRLDTGSGRLTIVGKEPLSGSVMPMAVSPDRRYLYASIRSVPYSLSAFSIDPRSGMLDPVQTTSLADNMAYLSVDRSGRYLLAASYSGNKVSVNSIKSNGTVNVDPRQIIPTGKNADAVVTDRRNRYVYVTNLGEDQIQQYRLRPGTGFLRPNDPPAVKTSAGAGPRHLVEHPHRPYWFVVNELNGTVSTYVAKRSGALAFRSSSSLLPPGFKGKPWAADIHVEPGGKFLYTTERASGTITAFAVDSGTGLLSPVGYYQTEQQPRAFNIDPGGKFLIVAGQRSNRLSVYRINSKTGDLTKVSEADAGKDPNWIEIIEVRP